jgi:D-2-hydroxyacid dehydrogenase (NADP+)
MLHSTRQFLIIAADQEMLGAPHGPHTFKESHLAQLQKAAGKRADIVAETPDASKAYFAKAEMVAAFPRRIPAFTDLPRARWLHSFSAGVDEVLTPEIIASKIVISNSSGIHATPIAEHVLGSILMFVRGFHRTMRNQDKGIWKKDDDLGELRGSNVLVVGFGAIGQEVARICSAFGAHVSAVARIPKKKPAFIDTLVPIKRLDTMLVNADFVVITLPYTKETHHLFDRSKFKCMKASAIVVNIGRGSIIKESDLVETLQRKNIAGAALDVTEVEPLPPTSPLWNMENVLITPHHSGLSHKYMDRAVDLLCKNIKAYLVKKRLPTQVDKKLGY